MKAISLPYLLVLIFCCYSTKILSFLSSSSPTDYYCCTTAFSPKSIINKRRRTDDVVAFPRYLYLSATSNSQQYNDCYIATENNDVYNNRLSSSGKTTTSIASIDDDDDDDDDNNNKKQNQNGNNELELVKCLTEVAIYHCGSEEGLDAMRELNKLCDRRLPFDFNNYNSRAHHHSIPATNSSNNTDTSCNTVVDKGERVISLLPNFLSTKTTNEFLELVQYMEKQKWMSTNPDSVDGLPSLHLNLVSQGKPLFDNDDNNDDNNDRTKDKKTDETIDNDESSFGSHIYKLYNLVRPYVYENLLPTVDRLLNDKNNNNDTNTINNDSKNNKKLRVSDIFLRRYGQDICGDMTRNGISIHYDVFSRITAVIALDDVASNGDNGLFTLSVDETTHQTSNHKALRRYFPLNTGDCVVHTWDVLHGVDVQPGLDRTSLIVWFDEEEEPVNDNTNDDTNNNGNDQDSGKIAPVSPWLLLDNQKNQENHNFGTMDVGNDVRQFVLASALASVEKTTTTDSENDEIWLYLRSASRGNTFALTRMGSICEEGTLTCVDMQSEAFAMLEKLRPFEKLPTIIQDMLKGTTTTAIATTSTTTTTTTINNNGHCLELACRFWLEAALRGNPLAQRALADEVMFEASQSGNPDQRLLAAVLFALASQQDDNESSESLSRVIEYDVAARNIGNQEEFLASPVVQAANAASGK